MRQRTYSMFTFFLCQERIQGLNPGQNIQSPSVPTAQMIDFLIKAL